MLREILHPVEKWLNYRLINYEEDAYGQPRQAKEGSEETQETTGSETGALITGNEGPR